MKRTVEVDMKKVGSFATLGTLGGQPMALSLAAMLELCSGGSSGLRERLFLERSVDLPDASVELLLEL